MRSPCLLFLLALLPCALWADGLQFKETSAELSPAIAAKSVTVAFSFSNATDKPVKSKRSMWPP